MYLGAIAEYPVSFFVKTVVAVSLNTKFVSYVNSHPQAVRTRKPAKFKHLKCKNMQIVTNS